MTTFKIEDDLIKVNFYNDYSDYSNLEEIGEKFSEEILVKIKEYFEMMKETEKVPVYEEDCLGLSNEDQNKLEKSLIEDYTNKGYRNVVVLRDLLDHQENPCGWMVFLNK